MNTGTGTPEPRSPLDIFSPQELRALQDRILESGALGRSPVYAALLDYLLNAAKSGKQPKEVEIAIDVMGRTAEFDVSKDSLVRVYIHQLRKRLRQYYEQHDSDAPYHLVIPKGQYTVAVVPSAGTADGAPVSVQPSPSARPRKLYLTMLVLLLANAGLLAALLTSGILRQSDSLSPAASHPVWHNIIHDDMPVLVVMGDYYIFGELDEYGRVTRMVRDFEMNSRQDLNRLFMRDSSARSQYLDLDMTYMPEGSAYALSLIMPVLQQSGKHIDVTMMSRLSTADLRNHHIIYIGYVSAMDKLNNLFFAASSLRIGRSFDELINRETREVYTSDAGLPEQGTPFRDVALLATFPAANNNQFLLITGTRDAGLMHSALVASDLGRLTAIDQQLEPSAYASGTSYEAVYEVFGLDRMNFDANLLYANSIDPARIWSRE